MNKKLILLIVVLFTFNIVSVHAQPLPGGEELGAASGQVVGGGGGADLQGDIFWLIGIAIIYSLLKYQNLIKNMILTK